ncbi:DNA alkylation repair protein [Candidatus Falkowbacteria bacterium CG10_big_fil_rev_8_21_14_0_10_37_18]|uniref:DNA alkylation repair protein n=1 Tax=Candidatus Falkowbacteria bacterium CG10_big_fil_rev_8_21_14_0_10_37_18 TaxID=1974562 RepID=A0A2H0VBD2_9BACT|nr:MAG: DNA alkylation repair protein [Candidatus Falkowbacteria bacterium CG10_big_fil_rev_8_21_14_0_10_37_18]
MPRLEQLQKELRQNADKSQAAILQRFFKTGPGQYGAGDVFLGLRVPLQRQIAARYTDLSYPELEALLADIIHEFRLVALLILVQKYQKTATLKERKLVVDFYLSHSKCINNWDLVDLSAPKILGDYLVQGKRGSALLLKMATSDNLWEKRIAMVSTYAFILDGDYNVTFSVAKKLLKDKHDLIHKAVGWMLREAGKRVSEKALLKFLDDNINYLPRTTLRYAIEKLTPAQRQDYLHHSLL